MRAFHPASRTVLHLAAALAAASALAAGCARPATPVAQQAAAEPGAAAAAAPPAAHPDVHRFRIGTLDAAVLRDGDIRFPNDGAILGQGRPKADIDAVLAAAGEPVDVVHLSVQALLVRSGDRVVLFDTGAGDAAFADAGRLPRSLRAAGVEPAAVTDIFLSHAHADHAGGLLDAEGAPAFANARIRMAAPEWQALQADAGRAALATAIAAQVEPFDPGVEVLPGVTAVAVAGHTPGHSAYQIADGAARLLYIGDSAHHHVVSVQRPRWTIQFDGDAQAAEDSREALLARAADSGIAVQSPHFPFPGLGRVARRDGAFAWVPEP
ncbi:MBL fold metallo-hydrolase [Luteimonas sp. RD2P54]|uniref:MBL fold metallo-hydrolase n=1 Tax=Luteimonas endophytica TaxID=3042023 RepID=A0ABT6J6K2_9GAMM|nr:MBL fold metallo-hydrolase [Luteimonas endophytica]MDH5822451.1 MBL fold metallo-hydrolase [Luteimonas endophytica]